MKINSIFMNFSVKFMNVDERGGNRGVAEADEDSGSLLNVDADAFIHGGYD